MRNCTSPYDHTSNPIFFVTNVILLPIIFGIGFIGNLLTIIVLNRSHLRTTNPIYAYLTGLAACDLLTLLLVLPKGLRDMAALPPSVGYSKEMAQFIIFQYGFSNVFKHAATWIIVFVAAVRLLSFSHPFRRGRWTTISASRIIVFVIVLFCLIVDFPRFFELRVAELKGHCLERMTLWTSGYTEFALDPLFLRVYPWVVIVVCFALPYLLMVVLNVVLMVRIKIWRIIRNYMTVTAAADGKDTQINILLLVIIGSFLILEIPDAIAHAYLAFGVNEMRYRIEYNNFMLISNCMSLVHSSINFIFYTLISSEFRKTFRRTFCCTCLTGDDYYEPVKCLDILLCRCSKKIPRERSAPAVAVKRPARSEPKQERIPRLPPAYRGPNVSKDGWI